MTKSFCTNEVLLVGRIETEPEYSHTHHNEEYYKFDISVKRYSGICDIIPVMVSSPILDGRIFGKGDYISIKGVYRSYNPNDSRKVIFYVNIKNIDLINEEINFNEITLEGYICKRGEVRTTAVSKRTILDVILAVNGSIKVKPSYIPCIIWNITADDASELKVGDRILIKGRVQSRYYVKKYENETSEIKTAYEVSVREYLKV